MVNGTVSVIPELEGYKTKLEHVPELEEQKRGLRVHKRLSQMYTARSPYIPQMERGLMLYDGIHLLNTKNKSSIKNDNLVAPFARIFVEAKTAEEVKAISEYTFTPVEDSGDAWKVRLLKDVNSHVRRKVKAKSKRHDMLRMKNIVGVSIAKIGYRKVMGMRKIRTETNDDGDILGWEERAVPIYDDIFMDVVSPFNFLVDPNATTMDDAMDCAHFHAENFESFWEVYHNNPLFKNTEAVKPGIHGTYSDQGFTQGHIGNFECQTDMVMIAEYYNKIRDEWICYANGVEIYYGPLPDDHKELPFISYHNNSSFCTGLLEMSTRTVNGEDVTNTPSVSAEKSFWPIGDPATISDLIELRTAHGRAAHRLIKRASQRIIGTRGNYRLPTDRNWMDGDEAQGAAGNIEVINLAGGGAGAGDWQWAFDDLFQLMRLTIGIDPSNLADGKQKTATEAEIQRETALRRLDIGLEYNEENGEVRMGHIVHKLIQQRYTKPELKRLLGSETKEELKSFDEVENDPITGKPLYGKRYRRIRSSLNIKESKYSNHFSISEDDAGVSSFLARPEYIRTSEIDIVVESGRKAAQLRSIEGDKYMRLLTLMTQILPLSQANPNTGESLISKDDLPKLRSVVSGLLKSFDMNPELDIGQDDVKKSETEKAIDDYMKLENSRQPLTAPPLVA